ncbi:hypothetical protein H0H92_007722 [Tricholoma furcatifolium]|nr:hypothetical protein H0H92_007722 [Tricholoma furcatifolium]
MAEKVSFTIRRPTPVSRASSSEDYKVPSLPPHLRSSAPSSPLVRSSTASPANYTPHEQDSSDEDEQIRDELVTGFDRFGVRRFFNPASSRLDKERPEKAAPLVIPALKNRDWRELARKRKTAVQYVPPSASAETGKDGSVGGLGTRDSINSGPVLSGLQYKAPVVKQEEEQSEPVPQQEDVKMDVEEDDEDKAALRAILAGVNGAEHDGPVVDIIPTPVSEADAYKQDVEELPESASLDDYARVPVSQFGAALLRGMGWKEGTAATRKPGKGLVEPYLPESRPALLGIGAKEQEVYDDGSKKKGVKRPEKRYVPLVKKERDERSASVPQEGDRRRERSRSPYSRSAGGSAAVSRRSSRSRERGSDREDRRNRERDREYKRDNRDRDRDRDRDYKRSDRRDDRRDDRAYARSDRDRDRLRDDDDRERRGGQSRDSERRR